MNRIFNPENLFFQGCGKVLDTVLLSLIWLVLCIPVVTVGPATTALYYAVAKCLRRGENEPYGNFFRCFKENFKTGAAATLLLLPAAGLLWVANGVLVGLANAGSRGATVLYCALCVCAALIAGVALYLFPLLSRFACTLGGLFARAGQLALRHLPSTVLLLGINLGALWLCLRFGFPYLLPFFFAPALAALLSSLVLERIFKKYTPAQDKDGGEKPWYLQ